MNRILHKNLEIYLEDIISNAIDVFYDEDDEDYYDNISNFETACENANIGIIPVYSYTIED